MSYILKLAGWYPSKVDLYNGDFVQRHAKSIALYKDIVVIYIVKDESINHPIIVEETKGKLTEIIAYYPKKKILDKLLSNFYYFSLFKKIYISLFKKRGLPELVHVNIVWKAGLLALRLKKKYQLPYVITENWTGYYKQDPNYIKHNQWKFILFQKVYQNANYLLPVTKDLGAQCNRLFKTSLKYKVIENAVDTSLFYPKGGQEKIIVHISTMGYQKNTQEIVEVFSKNESIVAAYTLLLIGPLHASLQNFVADLPQWVQSKIKFTGNIPYNKVAAYLSSASFLILFSRYENLPCVILESLSCGIPVISTDVGGIREVINDTNGILIESENKQELNEAMKKMITHYHQYNQFQIAEYAKQQYSFESIGKKFLEAYQIILK